MHQVLRTNGQDLLNSPSHSGGARYNLEFQHVIRLLLAESWRMRSQKAIENLMVIPSIWNDHSYI